LDLLCASKMIIGFIKDLFSIIVYISIGNIFGFVVGISVGMLGLTEFVASLPFWVLFLYFLISSIGFLVLLTIVIEAIYNRSK